VGGGASVVDNLPCVDGGNGGEALDSPCGGEAAYLAGTVPSYDAAEGLCRRDGRDEEASASSDTCDDGVEAVGTVEHPCF